MREVLLDGSILIPFEFPLNQANNVFRPYKIHSDGGFFANLITYLSLMVFLLGGLGLLGWMTGLRNLASIRPHYIPMAPDTALCLILLALVSLLLAKQHLSPRSISTIFGLSAVLGLYGLLKLVQYFVHIDLTLESFLFPATEWLGAFPLKRMSPITGGLLLAASSATLLKIKGRESSLYSDLISFLGALVFLPGAIATIGYLFGTPVLYGGTVIPMAATTACSFAMIGLAIIVSVGPDSAILQPFTGPSVRSLLLRSLIPIAILAVLIQGGMHELLSRSQTFNHAMVSVAFSVFFAACAGFVVSLVSRRIALTIESAETAKLDSEGRYHSLFDNMLDGFVHCRVIYENGTPVDFEFLDANQAFKRISRTQDIQGRLISELLPGIHKSDPQFLLSHSRVASTGVPEQFELYLSKVNRWFYTSIYSPKPGEFVSILNDITPRKQSEAALRDSEEKFRSIFDNALDIILVREFDEDKLTNFVEANPAATSILGYSHEELLAMNPHALEADTSEEAILARARAIGVQQAFRFQSKARNKKGETVWLDAAVHKYEYQKKQMLVSILRDVTERHNLEEQLRQSQKMEAIGRLAGGIAHDFNNLLTVISGNSELIMDQMHQSDPLYSGFMEIDAAATRAAGLTRQLLAFSRKQTLEPMVLDLNNVIADMDKMLRRLIGEDISLQTVQHPGIWNVKVDPGQIEQAIVNLAVNARDAMPDGGNITIETQNVEFDEQYCQSHPESIMGSHVMLAISDSGHGIPQEIRDKIFEPFFTTKPVGKGTGLGLSMVFGIVKQSGGFINVYSEREHGTVFKLYFPRVIEQAQALKEGGGRVSDLIPGTGLILVVEDEDSVRSITVKMLSMFGYSVIEATNGREAYQILQETNPKIDLLLTDVTMPVMGGHELAMLLKKEQPDLKVLYMSGYTPNSIVHDGVLDPGTQYISKPFNPRELSRKVHEALNP